jgi:hypothetical protein
MQLGWSIDRDNSYVVNDGAVSAVGRERAEDNLSLGSDRRKLNHVLNPRLRIRSLAYMFELGSRRRGLHTHPLDSRSAVSGQLK